MKLSFGLGSSTRNTLFVDLFLLFFLRNVAFARLFSTSFGIPVNATYDFIVVGGGTAGLTIASRLAAGGSVAIIEAGSFYEIGNGNLSDIPIYDARWTAKSVMDVNPLIDWGFVTTPQVGILNTSVHYARGKTLGGCSARNYMAYHYANKGAYAKWADLVDDPSYRFENWLPYFQKSVQFHPPNNSKRALNATIEINTTALSGAGPLFVTMPNYAQASSSWVQMGLNAVGILPTNGFISGDLLGSSYLLNTINPFTQTRDSSETSFLRSSLVNDNVTVYTSTLAKRVVFGDNLTAQAVEVETQSMKYTLSARREVIVSAGAFQSPQLLMVSGIGPRTSLERLNISVLLDRPGVGQNMWDHVFMGISYRVNVVTASSLADPTFLYNANDQFLHNLSGILTNPGGDMIAFEKPIKAFLSSDTIDSLSSFPDDWPAHEYMSMSGYLGYQNDYADAPMDGYNYATISTNLVAPQSRGTIDIATADTSDQPIINPNWLTHPVDQAIMVAGFKRVRQVFERREMQPVIIGQEVFPGSNITSDKDILDTIRRSLSTVFHAAATCAMGRSNDINAVVDSKARVIGTQRLRVVDASAFPFLPPGHPMATVYALAEKIANHILYGVFTVVAFQPSHVWTSPQRD